MGNRKITPPEDVFFNSVASMIKEILIDNVNYKTGHYHETGNCMISDTKARAQWVLDKMDDWKHLIKCDCDG